MISIEEIVLIHNTLIERFGGQAGVRDHNLLESAINRPLATFDQQELYPSIVDKVAALFESLIINHPFHDGNKRISWFILRLILLENGYSIDTTEDEKYEFVIEAASGKLDFERIREWIEKHLTKNEI